MPCCQSWGHELELELGARGTRAGRASFLGRIDGAARCVGVGAVVLGTYPRGAFAKGWLTGMGGMTAAGHRRRSWHIHPVQRARAVASQGGWHHVSVPSAETCSGVPQLPGFPGAGQDMGGDSSGCSPWGAQSRHRAPRPSHGGAASGRVPREEGAVCWWRRRQQRPRVHSLAMSSWLCSGPATAWRGAGGHRAGAVTSGRGARAHPASGHAASTGGSGPASSGKNGGEACGSPCPCGVSVHASPRSGAGAAAVGGRRAALWRRCLAEHRPVPSVHCAPGAWHPAWGGEGAPRDGSSGRARVGVPLPSPGGHQGTVPSPCGQGQPCSRGL